MKGKLALLIACLAALLLPAGFAEGNAPLKDPQELKLLSYTNGNQITGIGDPYVICYDGKYYCTATGSGNSYDLYQSENLQTWEKIGPIFYSDSREGWVRNSLWQPQLVPGNDGNFYLYYCGQNDQGSLRIGVAVCDALDGFYEDALDRPLMDFGYAQIDPNLFVDDDGRMYLYYSRDCSENVVNKYNTSQIYVIEMADYTHVMEGAEPALCVTPDQRWELRNGGYRWNEGPDMLKHDGTYYLFYSGGFYGDSSYSLGYATASSPLGPFEKYEGNPILSSTNNVSGPGNNSFFYTADGKELFNAYHTHTVAVIAGGNRRLAIDRCGWRDDGTFYMNGPSYSMQPAPSGETALQKVEGEFTITASATASGKPEYLLDGEFSGTKAGRAREWKAPTGEKAAVTIQFETEQKVDCLFIYRCFDDSAAPEALTLRFSDGTVLEGVSLSADSAEAAILYFDTKTIDSITIEAESLGSASCFGLAEVGIYAIQ